MSDHPIYDTTKAYFDEINSEFKMLRQQIIIRDAEIAQLKEVIKDKDNTIRVLAEKVK